MSIIDRVNYKLNLDFDNGRYWITKYDTSQYPPSYKNIRTRYGRVFSLPRGLAFGERYNEISFYPDGRCDEKDVEIVRGKDDKRFVLHIQGFGSQVEIEEIQHE